MLAEEAATVREILVVLPEFVRIFATWREENVATLGATFCDRLLTYLLTFNFDEVQVVNDNTLMQMSIGLLFVNMADELGDFTVRHPSTNALVEPMVYFRYMVSAFGL